MKLQPIVQDSEPPGFASYFVGSDIALRGMERYVALVEASFHGETHHAIVAVDTSQVFTCPMRCEGGLVADEGWCPVCNMRLTGDHSTRP